MKVEMSSFMALFSGIPNRSSNIICNSPRWNQIGQVGGTPGVEQTFNEALTRNG
jgi:hypothetical protein